MYTLNVCCNMLLTLAECDNRSNVACAERYAARSLLNANVLRRLDQGMSESAMSY